MKYNPQKDLLGAIRSLFPLEICPWDDYYPRMAETDYLAKRAELFSTKTYFYRRAPFGGSYCLLGGLTAFLRTLHDYEFNETVSEALRDQGYCSDFIEFLKEKRKLRLDVYAVPEGSVFFPNEPAIILEGELWAIRIAEGMLLKNVNYPTLSMTKWNRVAQAAAPGLVMEFSRRRSQDDLRTSLYAHLGGAAVTSNSEIRRGADIKVVGTMGHEFVQSFGDEYNAFDTWLTHNPSRPILLVDTIDTLDSGVPNAIKAFQKHINQIKDAGGVPGIRNDSGDLAYITIEERRLLDEAGLEEAKIYQTNELDEYLIQSIKEQIFTNAPRSGKNAERIISKIVWACGTNPGVCSDQPSLGGVAKLTSIDHLGTESPVIKIAKDNPVKTSIPGSNRSTWIKDGNELLCCLIHSKDEEIATDMEVCHPDDETKKILLEHYDDLNFLPRQVMVYSNNNGGDQLLNLPSMYRVRETITREVSRLHWTHKRFQKPHTVKVGLSEKLYELRQGMLSSKSLISY